MALVDLLFPKRCLQCGRSGTYICTNCIAKVKLAKQLCIECQKPAIDGITHVGCLKPFGLNGVLAGYEYRGVIKRVVKSIKYRFATDMAEEVAGLLVNQLQDGINALPENSLIIPVPLHERRQRWRGFNQAEELGRIIARKMGWRFHPSLMLRTKYTIPQVELKGDNRRSNIKRAFGLNPRYQKSINNHQSLIVFDDVVTTGATIREVCKVIKHYNKSLSVWGLSIAR